MRERSAVLLSCALLGACTVGNLTEAEVLTGLDGVMRVDRSTSPPKLRYAEEGPVASWTLRFSPLLPLQPLMRILFGTPSTERLENPASHARELARALGEKAGDSPGSAAEASIRLLQIATLDTSSLDRVVALDGLESISARVGVDLWPDLMAPTSWPARSPEFERALAEFGRLAATRRSGSPRSDAERAALGSAMDALVARPLPTADERVALLVDLAAEASAESDPELRAGAESALLRGLAHAVRWTLVEALKGREPALRPVRLRALEILHRAGGPDSVPVLLSLLAAPGAELREGVERFEDGPVRLRMIRYCGQLDETRAARAARLPGREDWEAISPLQFLCEQVLPVVAPGSDFDPFGNPMRIPAQRALCWILRRPVDFDTAWVRTWYEEFRRKR
ncbi:MAG: hypothetical protein Fur0037_26540 [Planctomycetota bacterium]